MKIKKILKAFPEIFIKGPKDIDISGITNNSKWAAPGSLFIAKKGVNFHGADYVKDAVAAGAVCICTDVYDPIFPEIAQIIVPRPEEYEAPFAAMYYQYPSRQLFTVGITGTSGKTTISYLTQYILEKLGLPTGLIGSIEYDTGARKHIATHTTPDNPRLQKYLAEMVEAGKKAVVMEVTSHALSQRRVDCIDFDVAVFSNLSQDHLDFHHTMEAYAAEKRKLFEKLPSTKTAVINGDCPWAREICDGLPFHKLTFGKTKGVDLQMMECVDHPEGICLLVSYQGAQKQVFTTLIGEHNAYNVLAAMGVALSRGFSFDQVARSLEGFAGVPGRMERIDAGQPFSVYVDFAHKPDALQHVLEAVKRRTKGKVYLVMGCGGDRDKGKRALMGEIAEKGAFYTFLADDNPRSEDPQEIMRQIAAGFSTPSFEVVGDREEAIRKAVEASSKADTLLITGKGHETEQTFAHHSIEFDDRVVVKNLLKKRSAV